jgi:hypothetical protein
MGHFLLLFFLAVNLDSIAKVQYIRFEMLLAVNGTVSRTVLILVGFKPTSVNEYLMLSRSLITPIFLAQVMW